MLWLAVPARADVQFDGTMGEPGVPEPFQDAQGRTIFPMEQGRGLTRGRTLFHSVDRLTTSPNEGVELRGASLDTVIVRNTGPDFASFDGPFTSAIEGADVMVVSPSGVSVGSGAVFDVSGSLYLSGASSVHFADGSMLDATGDVPLGVLTSAPPAAFGFGPDRSQVNLAATRAESWSVGPGERISITGRSVFANGASNTDADLGDPGADVQIGAADSGLLPLDLTQVDVAALDPGTVLGPVGLVGAYGIDVSTGDALSAPGDVDTPAGRVVIRGSRLIMQSNSEIRSANAASADAPAALDIATTSSILMTGGSQIAARANSEGGAAGADLLLVSPDVTLRDTDTRVVVSSEAEGRSGNLVVRAERLLIESDAGLLTSTTADAPGSGGAIDVVATESLRLLGSGSIETLSDGGAAGGDVLIDAPSVLVEGLGSGLLTTARGSGAAGALDVAATTLVVRSDGSIASQVEADATGAGGDVRLRAGELLEVSGGEAEVVSQTDGSGAGGAILVSETSEVFVHDSGRIRTETSAGGAGGAIDIEADHVIVRGDAWVAGKGVSDISTETLSPVVEGRGGDLVVRAHDVTLEDGGQIAVSTSGAALAGDLTVELTGALTATGSDVSSDGIVRASGLAARSEASSLRVGPPDEPPLRATLRLVADSMLLADGAEISASTESGAAGALVDIDIESEARIGRPGERAALVSSSSITPDQDGEAGAVTLNAERLVLEGGGQITTDSLGPGAAGSILVTAGDVIVRGVGSDDVGSRITSLGRSTNPDTAGDAGAVTVGADRSIVLADRGSIEVFTAGAGEGGSILLQAGRSVELYGGAEIKASAFGATDAGRISIEAGDRVVAFDSLIETRASVGGGGQVDIVAPNLVYLLRSNIDAQVAAGGGDGGDISIDPRLVVINDSDLFANAIDGNGGSITIVARQLLSSRGSERNVSSLNSLDGRVIESAPQSEVSANLVSIQQSVIDASDLMAEQCDLRSARSGSFTVVAALPAPADPDDVLSPSWLGPEDMGATCEDEALAPAQEGS